MNFETTIGLEVHVELKTNSKIFSPSPVEFGDDPNSNTNVIDWGYPGVLPSTNKGVVKYGIMLLWPCMRKSNSTRTLTGRTTSILITQRPTKLLRRIPQ